MKPSKIRPFGRGSHNLFLKGQQTSHGYENHLTQWDDPPNLETTFLSLGNPPTPRPLKAYFQGQRGPRWRWLVSEFFVGRVLSLNGLHAWSFLGNFALPLQDRLIGEANLDIGTTLANDDRCQKPAAEENLNST